MILLTHHTGEPHGILGAQAACTYLTKSLNIPSIVVGIERRFSKEHLLQSLEDYYKGKDRIIGFSHLCGRKDLIELIGAIKARGFFTVLGGPQAAIDYEGEIGSQIHPTRFKGLRGKIDLAVQGPADNLKEEHLKPGCRTFPWGTDVALDVDWTNLYAFSDGLKRLEVKTAQVLSAVGCAYARKKTTVRLPPPEPLRDSALPLDAQCNGCIFCDVSKDKGFHGRIDRLKVLSQIKAVPEEKGTKVPVELIDEYPIASLRGILDDAAEAGIRLSQINLVCRVDDIVLHREALREALEIARGRQIRILFSSIGFESFSDKILKLFNKGITVDDIARCAGILREFKSKFGHTLLYRRDEGANHGFIHPTPWDDSDTMSEMHMNIGMHRFFEDILPAHSTPLIIHHSSYLGDWMRQIEAETHTAFNRDGTWIEWWSAPVKST